MKPGVTDDRPELPTTESNTNGSANQAHTPDSGAEPDDTLWENLSVGERIQAERDMHGWTLLRLAAQIQIVAKEDLIVTAALSSLTSMLSRYEHNHAVPNENTRRLIAKALGVTVEHLGMTQKPYWRMR
ncbi:helix-turn-helix transcriptional regulator [Actinoplanes sp. TBRC 11911]|uniref:helix-turn-helix domain-containing protein n=1 Tax=Actinoplanes sp. TBRC 11911 TaxID=2729386 RepID=UPI00145CC2FE|nr:helix-turn-helix transcriptional regulator [Actinoplanes sp. TBRC 11911]NMO57707.1 helix-turn-helix transcriptional regulator [Actinoplanes sp. TBRC 11911]